MCSQLVRDICKYLVNAKIFLNTTLKYSQEKKMGKKHRTLENVDVQGICHMYPTETFKIYNKYPQMKIQNQEIILQAFLMVTIQRKHIQQSASVCHTSPSKFYLWLS